MTPNVEKVEWLGVAREVTLPAEGPPKLPRPPATDLSGIWQTVAHDGSTSMLAASLPNQAPTVEGLTHGDGAVGGNSEIVAASNALRQSPRADQISASELLAEETSRPGPAALPASRPEQASSPSTRSKIAMPLCATKLSRKPEPKRLPVRRPAASRPVLCARPLGSVAMGRGRLDPRLTRVMDAWPSLSGRTRDAILAVIDVALGRT